MDAWEILEGRFPAEFPKIARGLPMASSVGESAADTSAARACTRACPTTKSGFINSQDSSRKSSPGTSELMELRHVASSTPHILSRSKQKQRRRRQPPRPPQQPQRQQQPQRLQQQRRRQPQLQQQQQRCQSERKRTKKRRKRLKKQRKRTRRKTRNLQPPRPLQLLQEVAKASCPKKAPSFRRNTEIT